MDYKKLIEGIDFNALSHIKDLVYKNKNNITKEYVDGKVDEITYYKATSILTSQSRSPLWEKAFIAKNNAKKVSASLGKGDLFLDSKYFEYKISGANLGNELHIVQIRIWQNVGYIIQYVCADFSIITFELTHEEMKREIETLKMSAAHGTKEANEENGNIEYRVTLKPNSKDFKRWLRLYKTEKYK